MKTSTKKRNLVKKMLLKGESRADAMRTVKAKFGSGIASRDVSLVAREVKASGALRYATPSSPRNGKIARDEDDIALERVRELQKRARAKAAEPLTSLPTASPKAKETSMRRFVLDRSFDATGTSGTGIVAEGVQFSSGHVVIHWLSQLEAINVYGNAMVLEQLHGHNGNTVIKWLDP